MMSAPLEPYARLLVISDRQIFIFAGTTVIMAWIHRRIGRDARWLGQGRDRTQDPQFWFYTEKDLELFRRALKERNKRTRRDGGS